MKKFNYVAIDKNGEKINGVIEADDLLDAKSKLRAKRLKIVKIEKSQELTLFSKKKKDKKLKADTVSHFCRQFSIIIASGINSIIGLETLAKRTENQTLSEEISRIVDEIKKGSTISDAMLDEKSKFPKLLGAMVATGEETGTLEEVLKNMSTFYEKEYRIIQKIKNASTYPIIVVILSLVMLFVFSSFILPEMVTSIMEVDGDLPFITKVVMNVGMFMNTWWPVVLVLIIFGIYSLKKYLETDEGRYKKDQMINKIPILGKGINSIVLMRLSKALHLFISTGYPMLQGLEYIKESMNNSLAERALTDARDGLMKGESLAENLERNDYFDLVFVQMIEIGEQTGQLELISDQMSEFYEHESDIYLTRLISMIEPIMIIFVGIIVAILVIAVFLPMLSIYDGI
ncbi:MAG: type II secretion system F family protein [Peptostreptococcaceae bacterium]